MNLDAKNAAKLANTINAALAELDLKGCDRQITKAMTVVTEAFVRYQEGRLVTADELISKANSAVHDTRT